MSLSKPFPATMTTTFKWSANHKCILSISDGAPSGTTHLVFAMNSLYDPGQSVWSHQPRFFDVLCSSTMYQRYRVSRFNYSITAANVSSQGPNPVNVLCCWSNTSSITQLDNAAGLEEYSEMPNARIMRLYDADSAKGMKTMKGSISIWPIFGSKLDYYGDNTHIGTYQSDPTSRAYFHVAVQGSPSSNYPSGTSDYYVTLNFNFSFRARLLQLSDTQPIS